MMVPSIPPRPPIQYADEKPPPQQKPKVPVLKKHLVDQLSQEEQDSLNSKLLIKRHFLIFFMHSMWKPLSLHSLSDSVFHTFFPLRDSDSCYYLQVMKWMKLCTLKFLFWWDSMDNFTRYLCLDFPLSLTEGWRIGKENSRF